MKGDRRKTLNQLLLINFVFSLYVCSQTKYFRWEALPFLLTWLMAMHKLIIFMQQNKAPFISLSLPPSLPPTHPPITRHSCSSPGTPTLPASNSTGSENGSNDSSPSLREKLSTAKRETAADTEEYLDTQGSQYMGSDVIPKLRLHYNVNKVTNNSHSTPNLSLQPCKRRVKLKRLKWTLTLLNFLGFWLRFNTLEFCTVANSSTYIQ